MAIGHHAGLSELILVSSATWTSEVTNVLFSTNQFALVYFLEAKADSN